MGALLGSAIAAPTPLGAQPVTCAPPDSVLARVNPGAELTLEAFAVPLRQRGYQMQRYAVVPGLVLFTPPVQAPEHALHGLHALAVRRNAQQQLVQMLSERRDVFESVLADRKITVRSIVDSVVVAPTAMPASPTPSGTPVETTAATPTPPPSPVLVVIADSGVDVDELGDHMFANPTECGATSDGDGNGVVGDCHGIDVIECTGDPTDKTDKEKISHGTHLAGIVAERVGELRTHVGGAWDVKIAACRFVDESGQGTVAGAIACLDYAYWLAAKDRFAVAAVNSSWGKIDSDCGDLATAIAKLKPHDVLFVTSTGDGSDNCDHQECCPVRASAPNLIAVGAAKNDGNLLSNSGFGNHSVHLLAPGEKISMPQRGRVVEMSGTSMAAAQVTGVAGALRAAHPSEHWPVILRRILGTGSAAAFPNARKTLTQRILDGVAAIDVNPAELGAAVVNRRRDPITDVLQQGHPGATFPLSMLHLAGALPAGTLGLGVKVEPDVGPTPAFIDDGTGADQAAEDGIYSASWPLPSPPGTYTVTFPDGSIATFLVTEAPTPTP